jgi:hypothetical protein
MQFQVPQFLDIEDKVVGPFTIKQFLYIAGGVGLAYICYRFIPWFFVSIIPVIGILVFAAMLAFYKHNNKPLVFLLEAALNYTKNTRLYVWRRREKEGQVTLALDLTNFTPTKHASAGMPIVNSGSKLNDLTWTIDVEKQDEVIDNKVHTVNL